MAEPGLFEVGFSTPGDDQAAHDGEEPPGPYALLGEALDGLVAAGVTPPAWRPGAETACWSAVHGFATLHVDGPLAHDPPAQREADLELMLAAVERALTSEGGS